MGDDGVLAQAAHAAAPPHPVDNGGAQGVGADGGRVAGGVGGGGESVAGHGGRRVDGGADGEVDNAVGVLRGAH